MIMMKLSTYSRFGLERPLHRPRFSLDLALETGWWISYIPTSFAVSLRVDVGRGRWIKMIDECMNANTTIHRFA